MKFFISLLLFLCVDRSKGVIENKTNIRNELYLDRLECKPNPKYVNLTACYANPIGWNTFRINVTSKFLQTFEPRFKFVLNYRYNTYKPFLIDRWEDVCGFLRGEAQAEVFSAFYETIKDMTAFHKCPFENGELFQITSYELEKNRFSNPALPAGQYRLDTVITTPDDHDLVLLLQIFFSVSDVSISHRFG